MKVIAVMNSFIDAPKEILGNGAFPDNQIFVTVGKEYEIYALVIWQGVPTYQIVDDINYPAWYPAYLFDVTDASIEDDWECNLFSNKLDLILGPKFLSKSEEAYSSMVQLEPEPVNLFWRRVKQIEDRNAED